MRLVVPRGLTPSSVGPPFEKRRVQPQGITAVSEPLDDDGP